MKKHIPNNFDNIGEWSSHNQAKMKEGSKYGRTCVVCSHVFDVTKTTNHSESIGHILTDTEEVEIKENFFISFVSHNPFWSVKKFDEVVVHISVCPNCDHKNEMFCELSKETQKVDYCYHNYGSM